MESDFRWLWAAYQKGGLEAIPRDLDTAQFIAAAFGHLEKFSEQFMVETDRPIGAIVTLTNGYLFEPHAIWFPWASPRNKLEGALKFLSQERKDRLGVIYMDLDRKRFLEQMARYGVLRRVGTVKNFFEPGRDAVFFQTQEFK
ncbi:MAG: hypothetical protein ACR2OV_15810 [Hyphomicrobiaceae bacterium]